MVLGMMSYSANTQHLSSVAALRSMFHSADAEDVLRTIIETKIERKDPHRHVKRAYQAASLCRMAEYAASPITKYRYFKRGSRMLDRAIQQESALESVYLRLLIQLSVPRIFRSRRQIQTDVAYLESNWTLLAHDAGCRTLFVSTLRHANNADEIEGALARLEALEDPGAIP